MLVGKFFLHSGPEHYQFGEVIEQISAECFLIRTDNSDKAIGSIYCIVSLNDLKSDLDDEDAPMFIPWQFFASKKELDKYLLWLETPTKKYLKVVPFKKKPLTEKK